VLCSSAHRILAKARDFCTSGVQVSLAVGEYAVPSLSQAPGTPLLLVLGIGPSGQALTLANAP